MTWLYRLTATEIFFIGTFIVLYVIFLGRTFWLARQLKTSARAVIPKFFLRIGYMSLLFIALLGPSFGVSEQTVRSDGRDLFVLVDLSRSMDATDAVPTRLERVKFDVRQLTDSLVGDRFGLIGVADEAFLLTPLTNDHGALQQTAQALKTNLAGAGGTNLCEAIEMAQQKLMTDPAARQAAKAIILFSDGENFGTCDPATFGRLRTFRIPIITVGVGTTQGSTIRQGNAFVRDNNGQIVRSRLNSRFLTNLANQTGGKYVQANSEGQYIDDVVQTVRMLRGAVIDESQVAVATNKYYYFLIVAVVLLAIDLIVTVRTFRL
ncbi:MAG: VWA domain-containing protein [Cytophagales bacterium]|nr:MAG: VWA domain-containing protein [Cytophagales bacterium]